MSSNLLDKDVGVGAYLERERKERGIALAEISENTRVRILFLEKIEAEEFDDLPSIPVGRGFIRSYAKYIGVDADAVVLAFNKKINAGSDDIDEQLASKVIYTQAGSNENPKQLLLPVVAVVLFILASGAFLWFVRNKTNPIELLTNISTSIIETSQSISKNPDDDNQDKVEAVSAASSDKSSGEVTRETSPAEEPTKNPKVALNSPPEPGGEARGPNSFALNEGPSGVPPRAGPLGNRISLKIKALEDTWLRVVVDQKEAVESFLTAGSEKTWLGKDKFVLTVGNAAGTQVYLNGSIVSLPKTTSNVIRDFVITDKVAEFKPGFAGN